MSPAQTRRMSPARRRCPTSFARPARARWSTIAAPSSASSCRASPSASSAPCAPSNDICSLTASGTGGLEAAIVNHCPRATRSWPSASARSAIGSRPSPRRYGADVTRLEVEWGRAAEPAGSWRRLRAMADDGRPAQAVLLTHNETSTGVTNPLAELAAVVPPGGARHAHPRRRHQRSRRACPSRPTPGASTSS